MVRTKPFSEAEAAQGSLSQRICINDSYKTRDVGTCQFVFSTIIKEKRHVMQIKKATLDKRKNDSITIIVFDVTTAPDV